MAQGQASVLSDVSGTITIADGTSFSGPILAGMAACLWQALPGKTCQEIKQLITQSSDRFAAPTNQYGYGIPDFNLALSQGLSITSFSKNDFVVYPNPTSDSVSISFPEGFDAGTINLYTDVGQNVLKIKISSQSPTFSLKSLDKGIYFYKIESNGQFQSGKIIKQ